MNDRRSNTKNQRAPMRCLIFMLPVFIVGCSGNSKPTLAPNVTPQQQASAAKSMKLVFPPGTRFLLYHRFSEDGGLPGPDDVVHLKIELSRPDLETFLSQATFINAKWDTQSQISDVTSWNQWQPSKVKKYRSGQFLLSPGRVLNILIDDDRDDPKVVFLYWFDS